MNFAEFQLQTSGDPRLAAYAASPLPAWLWSSDGTRILWANPAGAGVFGAADGAALANRIFGPADRHRRQVARLAGRVSASGAIRLERLQGFGAAPGMLATCGFQRIDFHDGSHGLLIAASAPAVVRERPFAAPQPEAKPAEAPAVAAHVEPSPAAPPVASAEPSSPQPIEAPAEFVLFDAFDEPPAAAVVKPVIADEPPEPDLESVLQLDLPHVEATPRQTPHADATPEVTRAIELHVHEPSPYVEAVADEPANAEALATAPSSVDTPLPVPQRLPLRFTWRVDQDDCFTFTSDEFIRLIGPHTAANLGRPWREIAETSGLDPDGQVTRALATRATWSGIVLDWPVDGGGLLPVELSGLPVFDAARNFYGYRGFGVCRDLDALARLMAERDHPSAAPPPPWSADIVQAGPAPDAPPDDIEREDSPDPADVASSSFAKFPDESATETSHPTDLDTPVEPPKDAQTDTLADTITDTHTETQADTSAEIPAETPVETPKNVLPFRPLGEAKTPSLTPVENSAFNELARQLSARLDTDGTETSDVAGFDDTVVEKPAPAAMYEGQSTHTHEAPAAEPPEWLAPSEPPARGEARRDKPLLDLLPVGILIYRLDRLLYANSAFLTQMGYPTLHALEDAGGLDALYVEPGVSSASSTSDTGTPVTISASQPSEAHSPPAAADARLYTISWDGDSALALIFSGTRHEGETVAAAIAHASPVQPSAIQTGAVQTSLVQTSPVIEALVAEPSIIDQPSPVGQADAEELGAILDTTAEGIVMFDADGNINSANRSAEALFGRDGDEMARCNLADLFAPESQHAVFDYLAGIKSSGVASLLDHGRDVLGRESKGGIIPLSMTMGRTRADGPNFFAVFRDLSQTRQAENELREARRLAERAGTAKADVLARVSHEVRTPLNAIIGFAEVMIGERFGALGNERYVEYMKDIRASGERVIAVINDLSDLSRIETGKLDLAFTTQSLNELVESCVAVMQPQANRERIIIRTSLAHTLPPVVADARALRQITLNLIGNSIHLANAGGQVIVSTALSDFGEVMLRVRDTGHRLNDNEVAAALEPFRTSAPSDQTSDSGVSLSLTKALVEANRAKFQIKTGGRSGTLIEVVFPHAVAKV